MKRLFQFVQKAPRCFLFVLFIILPSHAQALVDTNENDLSDLWEKKYNNDDLFSEAFDSQADPDADGWTNAQEAAAGTDPFDANPPDGFLRPEIVHIPAVLGDPGTPEAVTVTWPTTPGKQYTLLCSPDLGEASWLPVEDAFIGNGLIVEYNFALTQPDKMFWRVGVEDADSDGDNLTNTEENQLETDANNPDSDGDRFTDGDENVEGTNPNNPDTDGDGVSDGREAATGHDSLSDTSYPPTWRSTQRFSFHSILSVVATNEWNTQSIIRNLESHEVEPSNLSIWLAADCPFPTSPPPQAPYQSKLRPSPGDNDATYASLTQTRFWLETKPAPLEEIKTKILRVTRRSSIGPNPIFQPPVVEALDVIIPAEETLSGPIDALPAFTTGLEHVEVDLVPMETAPRVLAVNSDFDEGRIDPLTGYAIPDCDDANIALEAQRNHLDGKFKIGARITKDMHPGWFGINPSYLTDFWDGANITISKIDTIDAVTGHPESGQVRFYVKWGDGPSEYRAIIPYDFDTLGAVNLVSGGINGVPSESVYGSASVIPEGASYYIEGVHPGKITLEWRLQKGDIDVKHEQTFEIVTHKTASQWKHSLAYKIRLETSNDPSGQINTYTNMRPSESYRDRMERASEYYDYYQDCFLSPLRSKPLHSQAISWPGLARLAGSQVVGGLSDSEYARFLLKARAAGLIAPFVYPSEIEDNMVTWSLTETETLQQALFTGARTIFQSIGWQMHAYRSSGYRALDWVESETGEPEARALVSLGVWKNLRIGILDHDKVVLDKVALDITDREQNVTIVPTWAVISSLGVGIVDYMFTFRAKNSCTPTGGNFHDMFPAGELSNSADRWDWIKPTTINGVLDTWNKHPVADRETLVRRTLELDSRRFSWLSYISGSPPYSTSGFPVWVWDNQDVP